MRCRSVLALLCGMSVLAIAGCTENPAASHPSQTSVSTATSPTPSQSPRPKLPVMPDAARVRTKSGLEAFAKYWMATADYLSQTGDSGPLMAASLPGCEWCSRLAKLYVDMYEAGGRLTGDLNSPISGFHLVGLSGATRGYVEFRARTPAHVETPSSGASPRQNRAAVLDYTLNAVYSAGSWKVDKAVWNSVEQGE
jgi:hypothetical protein